MQNLKGSLGPVALISIFLPWIVSGCTDCRSWTHSEDTLEGFCSNNVPYNVIPGLVERYECSRECLRDYPKCKAVNFKPSDGTCELLNADDPSPDVCLGMEYLKMDLPPDQGLPVEEPVTNVGTCSPGWRLFGSHCYLLGSSTADFTVSEWYCKQTGGDLVSVHSHTENTFVANLASGDPSITRMITGMVKESGLRDVPKFLWVDASPADFFYWQSGQPDQAPLPANCIFIDLALGNRWVDDSCHEDATYVCKKPSYK